MVLPIIIGIGATVVALTTKSLISAYRKYALLTPRMIASLNNIRLESSSSGEGHEHNEMHRFLKSRYPRAGFQSTMTEQEALLVLGIEGEDIMKFDKKMLRERYRKLMIVNHPDKNGSEYLSQKINQAKDILEKSYLFKKK